MAPVNISIDIDLERRIISHRCLAYRWYGNQAIKRHLVGLESRGEENPDSVKNEPYVVKVKAGDAVFVG